MSTQRGNLKKTGAPKHPNKGAWKNVYHDTSKKTKDIVATEVSGVCKRCKDVIDWRIKYKKYKPLSQPKMCVTCKQKSVKHAYHVYCPSCCASEDKCAKCGEKKHVVIEPSLPTAQQASEDRQLQFELEQLPERKRRTFLRLQEQGKLTATDKTLGGNIFDEKDDDRDDLDDFLLNDSDGDEHGDTGRLQKTDKVPDNTGNLAAGDASIELGHTAEEGVVNSGAEKLDNLSQLTLQSDNCS